MKRIFAIAAILMLLCGAAFADDVRPVTPPQWTLYTQVLTPTADASAQDFNAQVAGSYLYSVEIKTSTDDALTFTIYSGLGTQLFTRTTTAATSGDISMPTAFWPITRDRTPNWTLSGLGSGTITIEVTFVKR